MLDFPTRTIQTQSAPENAGTKHLVAPLLAAGMSVRAIAAKTGIPLDAVHRATI
jgi:hypothetical protein